MDMKLEVVVPAVADVGRAKDFYDQLGWRLDAGTPGSQFRPDATSGRVSGPDPDGASYSPFATFSGQDGNGWLQEVTTRLPGWVDAAQTALASAAELAGAMRRASAARGEHENRLGAVDRDWRDWYAAYMVAEQAGTELPR